MLEFFVVGGHLGQYQWMVSFLRCADWDCRPKPGHFLYNCLLGLSYPLPFLDWPVILHNPTQNLDNVGSGAGDESHL